MARKTRGGTCKLTLTNGSLVDSHILPKALTRAEGLGPGLVQFGQGKTKRARSSWYDRELVTEEGENILARYDDIGIRALRKHRLVWSGWGPLKILSDVQILPNYNFGVRTITLNNIKESEEIRMFLLSLLWRAAATSRIEFDEISLTPEDLDSLRLMVLHNHPQPLDFFPISLTQLSTIGKRHNMAPIYCEKEIPAFDELPTRTEPFYRFYFDGLIVHFSCLSANENSNQELGSLRVGAAPEITVTTVPYEHSFQAENLNVVFAEGISGRPLWS